MLKATDSEKIMEMLGKFGIRTPKELDKALRTIGCVDISPFCAEIKNKKECLK